MHIFLVYATHFLALPTKKPFRIKKLPCYPDEVNGLNNLNTKRQTKLIISFD